MSGIAAVQAYPRNRFAGAVLFAVASVAALTAAAQRPARVMSGYTGYFLGEDADHVERMIDLLAENGFNSIDVKVHSSHPKKRYIDGHGKEVKDLVDRAHSKGLAFNVYLYPISSMRNPGWPEHAVLPVPVDAKGNRIETSFLLTDADSWRAFYREALRYASLRGRIGFDSLRFDVETISLHISHDDSNWVAFCAQNPGFDADAPASRRASDLKRKNAKSRYEAFFMSRVKLAVVDFIRSIRAIDPKIELGYMPARKTGISAILNETLASDSVPAWLDGWNLYNGAGYTPAVKARAREIRRCHPMNRYIAWICPNRYKPDNVAASVYHAAANTDGYSIWVLSMLDDRLRSSLPKGTAPADYWAQFRKANMALRADMSAGTLEHPSRIAPVKVKPMVADLGWEGVTAPSLKPCGDGSGPVKGVTMRMAQNVFIHAKAGEPIRITARHLAGEQRPCGLQYVLLGPGGKVLRNEAVTAGTQDSFSVTAEETGVHVFRATAGDIAGAAWYAVSVASPLHWAVDARKEAYLFRSQSFAVEGADRGNPRLHIRTEGEESYVLRINGVAHDMVRCRNAGFDLPPGIVDLEITRSESGYGENFRVSLPGGKAPFLFPCRERRLTRSGTGPGPSAGPF